MYDEFILLLDFNSLYPSIIQEYNVCFSTVQRPRGSDMDAITSEAELMAQVKIPPPPTATNFDKEEGILPRVIRRLISQRKAVKDDLKKTNSGDVARRELLEIKQKAFKLTANSS